VEFFRGGYIDISDLLWGILARSDRYGNIGRGAGAIFGQNSPIVAVLLLVVAVIAFLIIYIRIISRLLIVELPLAIENNIGASSAIGRSWELTKGSVGRIQWIVFVGILVSLPITIVVQILSRSFKVF
jgi:membrane-anchored glycerophosphoryl diester phosphodiesterase (GDPDase)